MPLLERIAGKAASSLFDAACEHVAHWVKRKPKLYVHFQPGTALWCLAHSGPGPNAAEYMHVICEASLAHDDEQAMIIVEAFPSGTRAQAPMIDFVVPPYTMVTQQVTAIVGPLVGTKGKDWSGRLVFVDQFQRQHKSKKFTFKWVGSATLETK